MPLTSQVWSHTQTDVERGSVVVAPLYLCIGAKAAVRYEVSMLVGDGVVGILRVKKDLHILLDVVRVWVVEVIRCIVTPV